MHLEVSRLKGPTDAFLIVYAKFYIFFRKRGFIVWVMKKKKSEAPLNHKISDIQSKLSKSKNQSELPKARNQRIFNIVRLPYGKSSKIRIVNPAASVKIPIGGLLRLQKMADLEKENGLATINVPPMNPST